jgi:FkbM family methyltransferase
MRGSLRAIRAILAEAMAAAIARVPSLEPAFIHAGRAMARAPRVGGGLYWFAQEALMRRLRRSGRKYREVEIRTVSMYVDVTDATGRYPFFYATPYESAVTDAIVATLKPGDVFLDIGANIGYFSTLAARLVGPAGRVIAFEPHEGARASLRAIADRNEVLGTLEIVPVALADRDGPATLYTTPEFTAYSTLEPDRSPMREVATFQGGTVVNATTLDLWLADRPEIAARIRCIKIDVEGAEARVLAGMAETLRRPDLALLCETTTGSDADLTLERAGFERHRIESGTEAYGNFLYTRGLTTKM